MTELERRIDKLETRAAEVALLSLLACEPAKRASNAKLAQDALELADLLRVSESQPLYGT